MSNPRFITYTENQAIWMTLVTAITNFLTIPSLTLLFKRASDKRHPTLMFPFFIGILTLISSFMYHFTESIQVDVIFLDSGNWHKVDNVGAIVCFQNLAIFLMDNKNRLADEILQYTGLMITLLAQEKAPWEIEFTVIPILLAWICYLGKAAYNRQFPTYNKKMLRRGLLMMGIAIFCFIQGLNEFTDFLRIWHGLWHSFVAFSAFYLWQSLSEPEEEMELWSTLVNGYSHLYEGFTSIFCGHHKRAKVI
mmetsp:Transcript_54666/g.62676  ORF Transcript_54666/g.62676 Transcript_54666/m.62676 type:complete len:250 (-) Transcript_54666:112-861(-)